MTFCSFFRIILIGSSLGACVNQYTSPDGEVENTSTKPSSESSSLPSEDQSSSDDEPSSASAKKKETPDEAKRDPIEASGTCDDRSCVSTSDCCKGFQCGFDPERSKVTRYCLQQ